MIVTLDRWGFPEESLTSKGLRTLDPFIAAEWDRKIEGMSRLMGVDKISQLRKSCGVDPQRVTLNIRVPPRYLNEKGPVGEIQPGLLVDTNAYFERTSNR